MPRKDDYTGTHPQRGRRRELSRRNPGEGVYPAFTWVMYLGECETVKKLGYVKAARAHVRLVMSPSGVLFAVRQRRRRWWAIPDPKEFLTVEERSHQGYRAKPMRLKGMTA